MAKTKTCTTCKKPRPTRQFKADERHDDGLADICVTCAGKADAFEQLETVTIRGVEIFSSGGPYFGINSPPGGTFYTAEEIDELAEMNQMLASELHPANKIGHSKEQALATNSGYITEGEMPGLGWLTNFSTRDRDGERKLVVDIEGVPKKFAALIEARAYRKRSCEISKIRFQDGDGNESVIRAVTGLAWLGAKAPAVRTLDDVYEFFAEGDVIWDGGMEAVRQQIQQALNPAPPGDQPADARYWVSDVADAKALVSDWRSGYTYVVPFEKSGDKVTPAGVDEWKLARQAWVEAAEAYADTPAGARVEIHVDGTVLNAAELSEVVRRELFRAARKNGDGPADTSAMPEKNSKPAEYTDAQIEAFATGFGIEESDPAKRREAVAAKFEELGTPETPPTPPTEPSTPPTTPPNPTTDEPATVAMSAAELEVLKAKADRGESVAQKFEKREREAAVKEAIKEGRLDPARADFWMEQLTEEYAREGNGDRIIALMNELPVRPELLETVGYDDDGLSVESRGAADDAQFEAYAAATDVKEGSARG